MSDPPESRAAAPGATRLIDPLSAERFGWRNGLLNVAFWTLYGVVTSAGLLFSPLSERTAVPFIVITAIFLPAYMWAALTPPLFRLTRAFNLEGGHRPGRLAALAILGLAIAAAVSITLAAFAWLVLIQYEELGIEGTETLWLIARFRFLTDVLACLLILAAGMARDYFLRYQERQQEANTLRAQLVESRLQFLRAQLNPHFLSNTMNAVSALVSKDPRAVRRMIARLSELLRYTLEASSEPEVTLERELDVLRKYLEILEIRFQGRLRASITADDALMGALVPNLILQPLAENAMEHGVSQTGGVGEISIGAHRDGPWLVLTVEDSGAGEGFDQLESADAEDVGKGTRPMGGFGLRHARDRLEQLYGDDGTIVLRPTAEGGMIAEVRMPLRMSSSPSPDRFEEVPAGAPHG